MNEKVRKQMVLAMETVMRGLNDEDIFEGWLRCGVADGDLDEDSTWKDVDDWYIKDGNFTDLMNLFCRKMKQATADGCDGALYCNGVIS